MNIVDQHHYDVGIAPACDALAVSRATWYRRREEYKICFLRRNFTHGCRKAIPSTSNLVSGSHAHFQDSVQRSIP